MRRNRMLGLAGLAAIVIAASALPASADDQAAAAPAKEDTASVVVATVNGQPVTQGDLTAAFLQVGKQLQQQVPADRMLSALTDYVIDTRLAAKVSAAAGYDKDVAVAKRLAVAHDAVLYSDYFQRQITAAISDEAIQKRFDEELAKFVPSDEPHIEHILVKEEAEAKAIIAQLDQGADFAALAKEKSLDTGTAAAGGDLGFVPRGVTVPEFEAAAYALKPGTYTKAPVQSKYGWHVIKVTEMRKTTAPTLKAERTRIQGELAEEAGRTAQANLRAGQEITYMKTPADDAAGPAAPTDGTAQPAPPAQP